MSSPPRAIATRQYCFRHGMSKHFSSAHNMGVNVLFEGHDNSIDSSSCLVCDWRRRVGISTVARLVSCFGNSFIIGDQFRRLQYHRSRTTRKSRTAASRAVVSQQMSVAIPMIMSASMPRERKNQFQIGTVERAKPRLVEEDVLRLDDQSLVERSAAEPVFRMPILTIGVELRQDAKV